MRRYGGRYCRAPILMLLVLVPAIVAANDRQVAAPMATPVPSVRDYFAALKISSTAQYQAMTGPDLRSGVTGGSETSATRLKNSKKAFVLSLLVPGAGQLYTGSKLKAAAFFAVEAAAWMGFFVYHGKGNTKTDEFNAFADQNWSETRYDDFLDINWQVRDDDSAWVIPGDPSSGLFFSHNLPDTKTQQYYEMIGKYNQFVFGWADVPPQTVPNRHATEEMYSALRMRYEDMRHDANTMYSRATASLFVMMINHVASAFEAALAAKHYNAEREKAGDFKIGAVTARSGHEYFPMVTMTYAF